MVILWLHHGTGSGQRASYPATKLEGIAAYWEADIFIMGHTTKLAVVPINRVYPVWQGVPHLAHRKKLLIGAGGFSKGYIESLKQGHVPMGTYVEKGMMNPSSLGCPLITIVPHFRDETIRGTRQRVWEPLITAEV